MADEEQQDGQEQVPIPSETVLATDPEAYTIRPFEKTRIVVIETIAYQPANAEAEMVESRFTRWLDSDNEAQIYKRRFKATEKWDLVDLGWAKEWDGTSCLSITNISNGFRATMPTPEEKAYLDRLILEVVIGNIEPEIREVPDSRTLLLPPGESLRICPKKLGPVYVRCQQDWTRYQIAIFPK